MFEVKRSVFMHTICILSFPSHKNLCQIQADAYGIHNGATHVKSDVGFSIFIEMDYIPPPTEQYECMNTRYALSTGGGVFYRWLAEWRVKTQPQLWVGKILLPLSESLMNPKSYPANSRSLEITCHFVSKRMEFNMMCSNCCLCHS
jgi:hypothetical protein